MSKQNQWMYNLSVKDNFTYGPLGYVPLVVEDIEGYVSLPNYENDYIKDIQTIGEVKSLGKTSLILASLEPNTNKTITAVYNTSFLETDNVLKNIVHEKDLIEGDIIKVFGNLATIEKQLYLHIHMMLQITDPVKSLQTLKLTSNLASRKYCQFYHSERVEKLIEKSWENMKHQEKDENIKPSNKDETK